MSQFLFFLITSTVSLLCIFLLRKSDPKRARSLRLKNQKKLNQKFILLLWVGVFLPGIVLLFLAQFSAFLSWFGSTTILGWIMAAKPVKI